MSTARVTTQLKPGFAADAGGAFIWSDGTTVYGLKSNFDATTAPGINDDTTEGYMVGSQWVNVTTGIVYTAVDVTNGAAVWVVSGSSASPVNTVFGRTGTVVAASGDYTASQITNVAAGNIAATDVQTAINELDTEKVPTTRTLTAGSGLSGGGTLAADRSFALDITGLSADTTPGVTDVMHINDGANKKMTLADVLRVVNGLTAITSLAVNDIFLVLQESDGFAAKKMTKSDLATAIGGGGGGAVSSVFGRTGAVTAQTSDYAAAEIDFTTYLTIAGPTVQDAIEELKDELDAGGGLGDTYTNPYSGVFGPIPTGTQAVFDDIVDSKADMDADGRLPHEEFPSNWQAIRFARAALLNGTSTGQIYDPTGGSPARGRITLCPLQIDGVTLTAGDRVLIMVGIGSPADYEANGIWTVDTAGSGGNGVWVRSADWDDDAKVGPGTLVQVNEGTLMRGTLWKLDNGAGIVVGGASGTALTFSQILTAGQITAIITEVTGSQGPSVDDAPNTPNAADDEFTLASLDTAGTRFSGATAWAWVNQGGASLTFGQGHLVFATDPGDADDTMRGVYQTTPAAPWKFRAKVARGSGVHDDFMNAGLFVRYTGTGRSIAFGIDKAGIEGRGSAGTGSASTGREVITTVCKPWYLEIESDGTDMMFRYSGTGVDGTFREMSFFTIPISTLGGLDQIGIGFYGSGTANNSVQTFAVEWFRRVS
jgi:hypothetical protein